MMTILTWLLPIVGFANAPQSKLCELAITQLPKFIGRPLVEFPCREAAGEGAGDPERGILHFEINRSDVIGLAAANRVILDLQILPPRKHREFLWGPVLCRETKTSKPAMAMVHKQANQTFVVRRAWVMDQALGKVRKALKTEVKCEESSSP